MEIRTLDGKYLISWVFVVVLSFFYINLFDLQFRKHIYFRIISMWIILRRSWNYQYPNVTIFERINIIFQYRSM